MASFGFDSNGELQFYSEYSIKGVSTLYDIFPGLNIRETHKLLKFKDGKSLRHHYQVDCKDQLIRNIFYDFLLLVLDDISNGGMLVLPGKTNANIVLKTVPDDVVKRLSRDGRLKNIDIIKSDFIVPSFNFDFGPTSERRDRVILVPSRIQIKANKNAENKTIKYIYYRKIIK